MGLLSIHYVLFELIRVFPITKPHTFYNSPNRIRAGTNPHLDYAGAGPRGKPLNMVGLGKEFPVTSNPVGYTGGRPGAMRVITQDGED